MRSRKRKLDVPEAPQMEPESTPFLCNIVQPSKRNITLGMSLAFPSPKTPRATDSSVVMEAEETQPKQGKRPRYSLFPRPIVPRNDIEVSSVLQTPPIHRTRRSEAVTGSPNRPASILKDKMNRFMNNSMFNNSQTTVISDAHLSDEEGEAADTSSKHLRFTLPQVISSSTSGSEVMDTMDVTDKDALKLTVEDKREEEFLSFLEETDGDASPVRDTPFSTTCYDMDITHVASTTTHCPDELIPEEQEKMEDDTNLVIQADTDVEAETNAEEETEADKEAEVEAAVDAKTEAQINAGAESLTDADMEADADVDAQQVFR